MMPVLKDCQIFDSENTKQSERPKTSGNARNQSSKAKQYVFGKGLKKIKVQPKSRTNTT